MKTPSKKKLDRLALEKWKKEVYERDQGKCQICVSNNISKDLKNHYQTHHIIPRQYKELRYDINNGIILCFYHHKLGRESAHNNALFFSEWLKKNKKDQYAYLIKYNK